MFRHASLFTILVLATLVFASSGDKDAVYAGCVSGCETNNCVESNATALLPLSLRIAGWTCSDDCKYRCMHFVTDSAILVGKPIQQYYGKWPFWRLGGMQEPASVLFSVLNLLAHARGLRQIRARVPDWHPMKGFYVCFALVNINAWVWSSIFHTRDTPLTEKMDYFSAALTIIYGLYYTVIRLFHLYPARPANTPSPRAQWSIVLLMWTMVCSAVFFRHVWYLTSLPRFDYTYNMLFNLAVGMAHNLLWAAYSFPAWMSILRRFPSRPRTYRPPYVRRASAFVLLTTAAATLELFDFAPWARVIDAHALWHLATVPIAALWYDFLVQDANDEGWREQKS